jgi:catechol-2,3-dioxygenase
MSTPIKLAHVVLQTNRVPELRDFYRVLLNAQVEAEVGPLCLLAYDEEHHRIALVNIQDYRPRDNDAAGMHHMSFTYASLSELLDNYHRVKEENNLVPHMSILHGPTVSIYYRDPDGNMVETQVDVFATRDEANAFMLSAAYQRDPLGPEFDPEKMREQLVAGVPVATLVRRPDDV